MNYGTGWTAGGTVSRSLTAETSWQRSAAGNWVLGTYYTARKYRNELCEYGACSVWYSVRATTHEGGAVSGAAVQPKADYCRKFEKGSSIKLNKNSATKWSAGLKLEKIVGLAVSSQVGYSNEEELSVQVTSSSGRRLCGTNRYPAEFPSRIVVKAP